MANLKITTDDKGIVFDNGMSIIRKGLNSVHYYFIGGDTLVFKNAYDKETIDSVRLTNLTLNGETLTVDNYDAKLKETLFVEGSDSGVTLPIEIADVDGLTEILEDKADLINGIISSSQLPSYVDDVIEGKLISPVLFNDTDSNPVIPETGKIYVDIDTNNSYRWSGSIYTALNSGIALGETSSTAYRGDRGKIAYDHSQTTGNAHNMVKADIGLGNVDNTSDADKPVSTATQTAIDNISTNARNYTRNFRNWNPSNLNMNYIDDNSIIGTIISGNEGAITSPIISRVGNCIIAVNIKTTQDTTIYIGTLATTLIKTSHPQYLDNYTNGTTYFNLPANFDDRLILYVNYSSVVNQYWYMGINNASGSNEATFSYPQLLKANKYTDWLQAPEDLIDLSDTVDNMPYVGLNRFVRVNWVQGGWSVSGNVMTPIVTTARLRPNSTSFVVAEPNTNYTFSGSHTVLEAQVYEIDINGNFITSHDWLDGTQTFVTNSNTAYFCFLARRKNNATINPDTIWDINFKLEKGTKVTDYTEAPEDLANIQIGGVNLLNDSGFENYMGNSVPVNGASLTRVGNAYKGNYCIQATTINNVSSGYCWQNFPNEDGKVYTVSMYLRSDTPINDASFVALMSNFADIKRVPINIGTTWQRYSMTFTGMGSLDKIAVLAANAIFFVDCVQLEEGNKVTSWSPAPEDIQNTVENIQIGGVNFIPSTNQGIKGWGRNVQNGTHSITEIQELSVRAMKATTSVASTGYNVIYKNLNLGLLKNKSQYTLSFDIYCEYDTTMRFLLMEINGTNALTQWYGKTITKDNWIHVEQIMNTTNTTISNQRLYIDGFNNIGSVTFANVKLEEGNKATSWSSAEEDKKDNITYGTSEQWTGDYWIDGNKIYQKTISLGPLPNATTKQIPHGITNISRIINMEGYHRGTSGITLSLIFADNTNIIGSISIYLSSDGVHIVVLTDTDKSSYTESYVTLFYTCTDR